MLQSFFKTSKSVEETVKSMPLHPWAKELCIPEKRYTYSGYPEFEAIRILRDNELGKETDFSNRTLIQYHNHSTLGYECPVDFEKYNGAITSYKMDVPIINIIGAGTTNNLNNYIPGMTYREVLFQCLHGAGVDRRSLDFLLSAESKDLEMPHTRIDNDRKTRSERALKLVRFGDYFFVEWASTNHYGYVLDLAKRRY